MPSRLTKYLRKLAIAAAIIAIALVALYFIGNPERDTLDAAARVGVPGSFVRLSFGETHYELTGADSAPTVVLEDLAEQLANGSLDHGTNPVPFYYQRNGTSKRDLITATGA